MEVNRKFEGSKWQKKMLAKPYIYNFFKFRIREYLDNEDCQWLSIDAFFYAFSLLYYYGRILLEDGSTEKA